MLGLIGNVLVMVWGIFLTVHEHEFMNPRPYDMGMYEHTRRCRCGAVEKNKVTSEIEWEKRLVSFDRYPDSGVYWNNDGIHFILFENDIFKVKTKIPRDIRCCICGELEPLWDDDYVCPECRKNSFLGKALRKIPNETQITKFREDHWGIRPTHSPEYKLRNSPETILGLNEPEELNIQEYKSDLTDVMGE